MEITLTRPTDVMTCCVVVQSFCLMHLSIINKTLLCSIFKRRQYFQRCTQCTMHIHRVNMPIYYYCIIRRSVRRRSIFSFYIGFRANWNCIFNLWMRVRYSVFGSIHSYHSFHLFSLILRSSHDILLNCRKTFKNRPQGILSFPFTLVDTQHSGRLRR